VSEEGGVVAGDVEVKREDVEGLEDRVDGGLARSAPVGISELDSDEEFGGGDGGDRDVGDGCGTPAARPALPWSTAADARREKRPFAPLKNGATAQRRVVPRSDFGFVRMRTNHGSADTPVTLIRA
jgi:hypothetical protein